jgi:hypothetical protein
VTYAGARIGDLYEVCGQAMKMTRAKSMPDQLTRRLLRREMDRQAKGATGLLVGTTEEFSRLVQEARHRHIDAAVAIVQPGVSKAVISGDIRVLLGGVERFLIETYGTMLRVIGSD